MSRTTTASRHSTAVAALALPAAASAHVTMNPNTSTAGAFTKLDVRVPNEQSDASTVKLQLQLPDGFAFGVLRAQGGLAGQGDPGEARDARADRRRPDHRGREDDHVDRQRERPRQDRPRPVHGLPAVRADPGERRRQDAAVQGDPDLQQRRRRPLDRRGGLRAPGAARDRHGGGRGLLRVRGPRSRRPRRRARPTAAAATPSASSRSSSAASASSPRRRRSSSPGARAATGPRRPHEARRHRRGAGRRARCSRWARAPRGGTPTWRGSCRARARR